MPSPDVKRARIHEEDRRAERNGSLVDTVGGEDKTRGRDSPVADNAKALRNRSIAAEARAIRDRSMAAEAKAMRDLSAAESSGEFNFFHNNNVYLKKVGCESAILVRVCLC